MKICHFYSHNLWTSNDMKFFFIAVNICWQKNLNHKYQTIFLRGRWVAWQPTSTTLRRSCRKTLRTWRPTSRSLMGLVNLIVWFNGIRWPGFDINLVKVKFQLSICRSFGARVSGSWRRIFLSSTRLSTSSEAKRFTIVNHCQLLSTIANYCQPLPAIVNHCQQAL